VNVPLVGTTVPAGPLSGEKLAIDGNTRNFTLLFSVLPDAVTVTNPVVAPSGTLAQMRVFETTVNAAAVPLNMTQLTSARSVPRILTGVPTLPEVGSVSTNGPSPTARLKTVPAP
jgi:hypothetical protein